MPLTAEFKFRAGELASGLNGIRGPIAVAATLAVRDAAEEAKSKGRANIALSGMNQSRKWQAAWQSKVFPSGNRASINAAAVIFHKIPYAGVFEKGEQIKGKPIMWLPITANLPIQPSGRKWTPSSFAREKNVGRLFSVPHRLLLVADIRVDKFFGVPLALPTRGARASRGTRIRRRTREFKSQGVIKRLPVFFGVPIVQEKKRFALLPIVKAAASHLGDYYLRHIPKS
jgi:hypothetical protein